MSNRDLNVALRLYLEANGLNRGLQTSGQGFRRFTDGAARDTRNLDRMIAGVRNQVAGLVTGIGVLQNQRLSGQLDRDLVKIRQTAGATVAEMKALRAELFAMSRATGQPMDGLQRAAGTLVAANMPWKQMMATIGPINQASAMTGSDPNVLANALTVAASSFQVDLSQPGMAVDLLDQMVTAGQAGKAELENLSDIFGVAGGAAAKANLALKDTLALIEVLAETTPIAQLPVMTESTQRLFNNYAYAKRAEKASGVPFFDKSGNRLDPTDILVGLAERVQKAPNDRARAELLDNVLKGADLTTVAGLSQLFKDGNLEKMRSISAQMELSSGAVASNLDEAIHNVIDQGARMRTVLRQVGDDFAMPINKAVADVIDLGLREKSKGGMGLSNTEVLGAGAGIFLLGGIAAAIARSLPGKLMGSMGRVFGDTASTAVGVAQGKALEHVAGITPVFVTNWPGGVGAGGIGAGEVAAGVGAAKAAEAVLKTLRIGGKGLPGLTGIAATNPMAMLGPGAAFLGGYGAGSYIYDKIDSTEFADRLGGTIATVLSRLGSSTAREALDRRLDPMHGQLDIRIRQDGRAVVDRMESSRTLDLRSVSGPIDFMGP